MQQTDSEIFKCDQFHHKKDMNLLEKTKSATTV